MLPQKMALCALMVSCCAALSSQSPGRTPRDTLSLRAQFEKALTLQRCGDTDAALEEYETFVSAAQQFEIAPAMYADVLSNMGALHLRRGERADARRYFEDSLRQRETSSTLVNLAILLFAEPNLVSLLEAAKRCRAALELNDGDARSAVYTASAL